jgi:glutamate-ammonia-ligase adenylyltransferase
MTAADMNDPIASAAAFSRYFSARLQARSDLREWLTTAMAAPFDRNAMQGFLASRKPATDDDLKRALRDLRQRVMATLIVRDLAGLADLTEVTRGCTDLAEVTVRTARDWHHADLVGIHGEPLDGQGRPQRMIVVGMGKLGGGELNVSSDIDLIFVYPEAGETAGPRRIDSHEFFVRLGKRLLKAIGEATGDGFVFRVDRKSVV